MKTRVVHSAIETNPGKLQKLDDLHVAYRSYVQICIDQMIQECRIHVLPSERREYFPTSEIISSQILKNAQMHAVQVVETWVKGLYGRRLKEFIRKQSDLNNQQRMEHLCCGKYLIKKAGKFGKGTISQEMVDLYWSWVWNPDISGKYPVISESFPMWMTETTCAFGPTKDTHHFGWWLRIACLTRYHTVKIPLAFSPYLKAGFAKTVLAKKRDGRWTFQFYVKTEDTTFDGNHGTLGVDVGLNVIAATSEGRLYGAAFKPKFDRLYSKVRDLRSNRQRQEMKKDSKRLHRLEQRLTGMTKTAVGTVANQLVKSHPGHTFVIEDLDLRGCRGQKRFAYRALHHSLASKAVVEAVNPAYTSQMCPSCGYISHNNRKGIAFICRSCGRKSHADVIGGINLLGRSEDKQIGLNDDPFRVKTILRERYLAQRRDSSSGRSRKKRVRNPSDQRLTVRVPNGSRIASNKTVGIIPMCLLRRDLSGGADGQDHGLQPGKL